MAEFNRIQTPTSGYIKQRATELATIRDKYRDRAREYAKVTIPSLLPEVAETDAIEFQHDYNTEGAKLVNALANEYVQTLFPAGRSFIKFNMEEEDFAIQEKAGKDKATIEDIFAKVERNFRYRFESVGSRTAALEALKQLIVTGNILIHKLPEQKVSTYAIDEYMVMRGLDGTLEEVITVDKKFIAALDPEIRAAVIKDMKLKEDDVETIVDLYTWIRRDANDRDTWYVDQAVEAIPVGDQHTYKTDALPWIPVMWNRTRREIYGRGLVEEHYGSFWTLSILAEAMAVGCVSLADIKYLVRPGSLVDLERLNGSESGTFHYGEDGDINAISTDRQRDIVMIKDVIETYKRHLAEVFMYLPGTMRDAERVTAEENRLRARSLEKTHGGVYSTLGETFQEPYAKLLLAEMNIGDLEQDGVRLTITTGLDALSRGNENDKINHWIADLNAVAQVPEPILATFDLTKFAKKTAAGRDVDHSAFVRKEEEQAQVNAQNQAAQERAVVGQEFAKKAEPEQLAAAMQQG